MWLLVQEMARKYPVDLFVSVLTSSKPSERHSVLAMVLDAKTLSPSLLQPLTPSLVSFYITKLLPQCKQLENASCW